ncbi:hypothetical protein AA0119_g11494 [Alternaria tenuissima]|uniref:Zn(2)-C6 fungal-type domain-containing protein n=2 Tax=Alternaria alternata complex TaxID=187734 RepID=A0A4Q4MU98_ALTAL|nr:hypothetical protein AA0115_g11990 [Alternaria tenuissima]RYN60628.1 hypothetical protein AA0117_g13050 [Alternaria alternata]RYN35550.1 hypothetical protein AA0114_g11716 [Alternaria tenuissima]RYN89316.1 hypothetical protein AA0119_g11494 [Alternaria tenuissima]RYO05956.1 hypothetical protein AA0121_g12260 [Alternaria tenuissima]
MDGPDLTSEFTLDSGPGQAQVRRKQARAIQACNLCRARKQKCDGARPCQFCSEHNFDCQYNGGSPPRKNRSMMQLQDSINNISVVLKDFIGEFSAWQQDVESRLPLSRGFGSTPKSASLEAAFVPPPRDSSAPRVPTPTHGKMHSRPVGGTKMESPMFPYSNMSTVNAQAPPPIEQEAILSVSQQPATPTDSVKTDNSRTSNSLSSKERIGLQSDHTTPAHKLFEEWDLMKDFPIGVEYLHRLREGGRALSDYPMQLEQDRGLLRVWCVGEGSDLNDGLQGPGSPESSNDSDAPSPIPEKEGLWGHPPANQSSLHPSTNSSTPRDYSNYKYGLGGLGPDGRPDFRISVVDKLHKSYMEHMHSLHPFLNRSQLQRMIREFKERYSPDGRLADPVSPAAHQFNPSLKRKRSNGVFGEPYSFQGAIERSLRNAIILLVLALGKVCSYKKSLPHPQNDKSTYTNRAWGSFSSHTNGNFNGDSSDDSCPRNIDILPGMAYFSYATDILGYQQGGHTVEHAQAMILAALYTSQFTRVLESWSWINSACRVTMVLLKQDYHKLSRDFYTSSESKNLSPKERYRLELILLVYWTCLQLESDIVAEMSNLPTSDITVHQNQIMYPTGVRDYFPVEGKEMVEGTQANRKPEDDKDIMIYSSQIWMRVILNEAHNALYGANGNKGFDQGNIKAVAERARSHIAVLDSWRRVLPEFLAWKDGDPPSTDLNLARLRAKYYGGSYMMLRPYLRIASHITEYAPPAQATYQNGHWSHNESPAATRGAPTPTNRPVQWVDLSEAQKDIISIACQCIENAIQSTIAFDRVGAPENSPYGGFKSTRNTRLVLTNIFGTLHAQFGNMLVLAAVFKSRLYYLLPFNTSLTPQNLHTLFERTFEVLSEVAPNSPILKVDLDILRNVRSQLNDQRGLPPFQL